MYMYKGMHYISLHIRICITCTYKVYFTYKDMYHMYILGYISHVHIKVCITVHNYIHSLVHEVQFHVPGVGHFDLVR